MIRRLLTVNRGKITVRIVCACKEMNIEIVAVYSTANEEALHVQLADYAVYTGDPRANGSYPNTKNILSAAYMTACSATRPDFGFLSENVKFIRLVLQYGLVLVDPNPGVIEQMGDKNNARRCVVEARVPVIPGGKDLLETVRDPAAVVERIGYPALIKASSGGSGHGIRHADCAEELADTSGTVKVEARANFGDGAVHTKKFIVEPKHIEVQLVAGRRGNVMHLYERDCSCQRRDQKLLEEAPCHILEEDVHEHLLRDVVRVAENVSYDSVGTIESLLDVRGEYYFIEMNTQIRMEHIVSEEICGIDLIKQQIRIANGHKLAYRQEDIACRGHAIECHINAENIKYNFMPNPGQASFINLPLGRRVRIESAIYSDYNIPPYYDSMIAKVITYADTRLECIKRMCSALEELLIEGVETDIEFRYLLLYHPTFVGGRYDTDFMESFIKGLKEDGAII